MQGLCSASQPGTQVSVECFTAHRHLQLVERVLHHVVRIQLVNLVHDRLHIAAHGIGEEQEFSAGQCLEARQAEPVRLEELQARCWNARVGIAVARGGGCAGAGGGGGGRGGGWGEGELGRDGASNGMDTVSSHLIVRWSMGEGGRGRARVGLPVEGPCQNEVVVGGQLAQTGLELALVDETPGLVDDDEREHGPGISCVSGYFACSWWAGRTW